QSADHADPARGPRRRAALRRALHRALPGRSGEGDAPPGEPDGAGLRLPGRVLTAHQAVARNGCLERGAESVRSRRQSWSACRTKATNTSESTRVGPAAEKLAP